MCDEYGQILVDAGEIGHLDLASSCKDLLLKLLAVWADEKRTDHPPVNPCHSLESAHVWLCEF